VAEERVIEERLEEENRMRFIYFQIFRNIYIYIYMKSLRLKRGKHSKSRKGGNGSSSSSSSQVSFKELTRLIYQIKEFRRLLIEEEMDPGTNDPEELKEDIERNVERILSIFNGDRIDLSQLTQQETDKLLQLIVGITGITDNYDEVNTEINNQIIEAYAQAYLRYKDTHNSDLLEIENLNNEIKNKNELIDMIESGEDDTYESEDDKQEAIDTYMNEIKNLEKIRDIFIAEKNRMVSNISFLPKEKDPGPNALSTDRGLLPDPLTAHVMSYLSPNSRYQAEEPKQYETVLSNAIENIKKTPSRKEKSSSSSSALGGRRTRRKSIRKKSRRKKSRRRKTRRRK
jgi:hypothetical protein